MSILFPPFSRLQVEAENLQYTEVIYQIKSFFAFLLLNKY